MNINIEYFSRSILVLETSLSLLDKAEPESIEDDMFWNAVVQGFELTLEAAGKLLRIGLRARTRHPHDHETFTTKDVFLHAAEHHLLRVEEVERWLAYLDLYNAADDFTVEDILNTLPSFIADARELESTLRVRAPEIEA